MINFSTVSTNENCCDVIGNHDEINKTFVVMFEKYPGNEEIIVRLAYTMGNIVAKHDRTRIQVSFLSNEFQLKHKSFPINVYLFI